MAKDINVVAIEPEVADMLFKDAAREWLDSLDDVKETSMGAYKHILRKYIIPKIGDQKIGDVMKFDFMKELEAELNSEYSPASVSNIFTVVRMIARSKLGDYSEIASMTNVLKGKKVVYMKKKEVKDLLLFFKKSDDDPRRMGVMLALYAGLTTSEICALKWKDIDLLQRSMHIRMSAQRTVKKGNSVSKVVVSELDDEREVPINRQLEDWIIRCKNDAQKEQYVLSNSESPVDPRTLNYYLTGVLKKAKIKSYTFSQIRDTFIVYALQNGAEIAALSSILGISISRLEDAYGDFIITRFMDKLQAANTVFF